eukprot:16912-Heterococcus_DN1.PRE.1
MQQSTQLCQYTARSILLLHKQHRCALCSSAASLTVVTIVNHTRDQCHAHVSDNKQLDVRLNVVLCSKADDQKLLLLTMHLSAQTLLTAGTVDNVSKTDHVTMLHQSRALVSQLSKAMIGLSLKPSA